MGIEELLLERARREGEKRGEKRGEQRATRRMKKVVMNLLKKTDFSDKKIASIAGVSTEWVAQIKAELNK